MSTRVLLLGSTGSIGRQALDIIKQSHGQLELVGLCAEKSWELLLGQARQFAVSALGLADSEAAKQATCCWDKEPIRSGKNAAMQLVLETEADIVLNAMVGVAGLAASVATLTEGMDLALANKESLVVGGELLLGLAQARQRTIWPVDSEHSALHQLLVDQAPGSVDRITLTASGGPFRNRQRMDLANVSVKEALAHPTWSMGGKISIDSATLMNKGLEVIEAHQLFGLPYEQIDVVIHPQSIVHATVTLNDGSTLAHLGYPDMRVPISYGLYRGERVDTAVEPLDLASLGSLTFSSPDTQTFRCLELAYQAGKIGGTAPCVLNAANEVAVETFLAGKTPFLQIAQTVEHVLEAVDIQPITGFEMLDQADKQARSLAHAYLHSSTISV